MNLRIICDSSCDISQDEALNLNINVLPLNITINDKDYKDGIDISKEEFYKLLQSEKKLPKTSQISPAIFADLFEEAKNNGDDVLVITIAGVLSGTSNSARIAKEMVEYDNIEIVDSCSVIGGFQILVHEAVRLRDEGKSLKETANYLNNLKKRIKILGAINTLENLKKGGRLSFIEATIGTLINIKPIISFNEVGKINVVTKTIGMSKTSKKIVELINKHPIDLNHEVIYYYSANDKNMNKFIDELKENNIYTPGNIVNLSPVVGTHIGENAYAICYIEKE